MDIYDTYSNPYHHLKETAGPDGKRTQYYLHDAGGNVLCIYEVRGDRLYLKEQPIYGSSRLGVLHVDELLPTDLREGGEALAAGSERYGRFMGERRYELGDHLGNVQVTLSDRKQEKGVINGLMTYTPELFSSTDYYPYGLPMPDRTSQAGNYRYGFNGQEMDNEIYGEGKSYNAEFWQYDARLGRRWNVDPIRYPSISAYATFANNPVMFSDILGLDTVFRSSTGIETGRNPGGDDVWIFDRLPEVDIKSSTDENRQENPYRTGSLPWQTYNRNIDNPNLWNNRFSFSLAGSGQSEWMRDFNRAFGTLLLVGMTGPFVGELAGAAIAGSVNAATAIPSIVRTGAFYTKYYGIKTIYHIGRVYRAITLSYTYINFCFHTYRIPWVQSVGGFIVGATGEYFDLLPPDLSFNNPFFNMGVQSGSIFLNTLIKFSIIEPHPIK